MAKRSGGARFIPLRGIAVAVVLAAQSLTFEARAECPGGHIENFNIDWRTTAETRWTCFQSDSDYLPDVHGATGQVECYTFCHDGEGPLYECPGPAARFTVSGSAYSYTIIAHVEVTAAADSFRLQNAYASIFVRPNVAEGEVLCTPSGASKYFNNGDVYVEPIEGDPEEPTESYGLYCSAWSMGASGSLDCTLTVTYTPLITSGTRRWNNPAGGGYHDANNWDGYCSPVHDAQRSDAAWFDFSGAGVVPVSGAGATAAKWKVSRGRYEFSGSGELFADSASVAGEDGGEVLPGPSLLVQEGGWLRLTDSASLDSVHTAVGPVGTADSVLEIKGGSWTNSGSARIGRGSVDVLDGGAASTAALSNGSGNGPGSVHVTGDASDFDVTGEFVVGDTTAGTLDIDKGLFSVTPLLTTPIIGKSAPGIVTVHGDDSSFSSHGRFQVNQSLIVGDGASGRLNVERGGHVSIDRELVVNSLGANPAGEVVVDAQGGVNMLDVLGGIFVGATELREVLVQNGGRLSTNDLFIGYQQFRPGSADVTLRGASGSFPTLTVGTVGVGGEGTFVGDEAPGQLNIQAGASAELNNGLYVGAVGQGIVIVAGPAAPPQPTSTLTVTGETQVGIGASGIVQLDAGAVMETNGDLTIGLGGGNPSGSVSLDAVSNLRVNGTLAVGESGIGLLNILSGSFVRCGTLLVGGQAPAATGIISLTFFSVLTVDGNAQVGVGSGHGEILLADSEANLHINGNMTIGNPSGGPGGGSVVLVGARIEGTGNIVVNSNGSLSGTGTVAVPKVNAGGIISPALSPGTLTIDGDYEQLPGGTLIIEYAGLNPGEFDVLHVTGQTTLGGRLEVYFRNGFSPADPSVFIHSQDFVEADQGITGDYDQRIYAFPDLFADFDDDGDKDLRDVAAFQNCFGLSGEELEPACTRADWEGDGTIGEREIQELIARLTGP